MTSHQWIGTETGAALPAVNETLDLLGLTVEDTRRLVPVIFPEPVPE